MGLHTAGPLISFTPVGTASCGNGSSCAAKIEYTEESSKSSSRSVATGPPLLPTTGDDRCTLARQSGSTAARMSGGEGLLSALGSSCAPHPVTQHALLVPKQALATPQRRRGIRNQVLQSLTVKRGKCASRLCRPRLGCPRGIGQQQRTLSRACTLANCETRPHELCSHAVKSARLARDLLESIEATPCLPAAFIPAPP